MKVGIGIPTSEWERIPLAFMLSFQRLIGRICRGESVVKHYAIYTADGRFPIDVARNHIVRQVLANPAPLDALMFIDADHVFPDDLIDRLAAHDKPVITARYHQRKPPYLPVAYVMTPNCAPGQVRPVHYGRGCFEIDRGGAGALLIQRQVLEDIGEQWFRYGQEPLADRPPDMSVSEDFHFFEQAQQHGHRCWCDWETEAGHLIQAPVTSNWLAPYLKQMDAELTPELADQLIACGFDGPISVGGHIVQVHGAEPVSA